VAQEIIWSLIGSAVVGGIVKLWIMGLDKKIERLMEQGVANRDFMVAQLERNAARDKEAGAMEQRVDDIEDRVEILEGQMGQVKIYHKQHHGEEIK
jgi:hypothetical protein